MSNCARISSSRCDWQAKACSLKQHTVKSKDIHHVKNIIYYSCVNDVKGHISCILWEPKYL